MGFQSDLVCDSAVLREKCVIAEPDLVRLERCDASSGGDTGSDDSWRTSSSGVACESLSYARFTKPSADSWDVRAQFQPK